jgi:hypothetical protein
VLEEDFINLQLLLLRCKVILINRLVFLQLNLPLLFHQLQQLILWNQGILCKVQEVALVGWSLAQQEAEGQTITPKTRAHSIRVKRGSSKLNNKKLQWQLLSIINSSSLAPSTSSNRAGLRAAIFFPPPFNSSNSHLLHIF